MTKSSLDTIYDHYKDTCGIVANASKRRDRLMAWSFGGLVFFAFEFWFPLPAGELLNKLIEDKLGLPNAVDVGLIGSIVWLGLLLVVIRYFQTAAYVERLYPYLHKLEDRVNESLGADWISREGRSYLADYPKFQSWLAFLYQKALPSLLFIVPSIRIAFEMRELSMADGWQRPTLYLDIVIWILFVVSTFLYVEMIFKRKTKSEDAPPEA